MGGVTLTAPHPQSRPTVFIVNSGSSPSTSAAVPSPFPGPRRARQQSTHFSSSASLRAISSRSDQSPTKTAWLSSVQAPHPSRRPVAQPFPGGLAAGLPARGSKVQVGPVSTEADFFCERHVG